MHTRYLEPADKAIKKYLTQKKRDGYSPGLFSCFRHRGTLHPSVQLLLNDLGVITDEEQAKQRIIEHLQNSQPWNNHSFKLYLLDALKVDAKTNNPDENWDKYNPNRLHFYTGTLYKGTQTKPAIIFTHGFKLTVPVDKMKCIQGITDDNGISTTPNKAVAEKYARRESADMNGMVYQEWGYVYQTEYRGDKAIDLPKTWLQRRSNLRYRIYADKQEVNVLESIPPSCIVCAWDYTNGKNGKLIQNPNYRPAPTQTEQNGDINAPTQTPNAIV